MFNTSEINKMDTKTHLEETADAQFLAYGREVGSLLSNNSAESWKAELWTMFGGYIVALKDFGHAPELCNTYFSFKELLEFFEKVERIRLGETEGA
ncbi:MAG: hypothetical protein ABIN80_30495 [Dyadobacter sp.]|uniref:hypothetical protein n=1 Tax=Dyadobacter sp. TaxID=1914288 RepID=UPI003263E41A